MALRMQQLCTDSFFRIVPWKLKLLADIKELHDCYQRNFIPYPKHHTSCHARHYPNHMEVEWAQGNPADQAGYGSVPEAGLPPASSKLPRCLKTQPWDSFVQFQTQGCPGLEPTTG